MSKLEAEKGTVLDRDAATAAMRAHNTPTVCPSCRPGDSEGMCDEMSRLYAEYLRAEADELGFDPAIFPGVRAEMRRSGVEPPPLRDLLAVARRKPEDLA